MDAEQEHHLLELRRNHERRLRELEKRAATFGNNTPAEIVTEIEDIQEKLAQLNLQLGDHLIRGSITTTRAPSRRGSPTAKTMVIVAITLVIVVVVLLSASFLFFSREQRIEYVGRVLDNKTLMPVRSAKITLEFHGAPPIVYTDSEGVYRFILVSYTGKLAGRIHVEVDRYEPYERNITLSTDSSQLEDIRLNSQAAVTGTASSIYSTSTSSDPSLTPLEVTPGLTQTASLATVLPIVPAQDNETLIIVVPFDGKEDVRPEARIYRSIIEELHKISDLSTVRVERYPTPILEKNSEAELEYILSTFRPSVIIWGWFDDVGITANFRVTTPKGFFFPGYQPSLSEALRLNSQPDDFVFYIARRLPQEADYVTLFTISQLYTDQRKYNQATQYLERAILNLPDDIKNTDEEYNLQVILAWTKVLGSDDYEYAIAKTSLIISKSPKFTKAYALRANCYELQALSKYIQDKKITVSVTVESMADEHILTISSDQDIPLEAFKSENALNDYIYLIDVLDEQLNYYPRGRQYYVFGRKSEAISDMKKFVAAMGQNSFLAERAKEYIAQWSSELQIENNTTSSP